MLRKKLFGNPVISEPETNSNKRPNPEEFQEGVLDLSLGNCNPCDVSKYFPNLPKQPVLTLEEKVLQLQLELNNRLRTLNLKTTPVEYIYNPLEYAFSPNKNYVRKYCTTTKKILFVGMNPGPFGMCQTGVPFGDPRWVRDWLQIEGIVSKPEIECPERKILGFSSTRKEQSGERFWSYFAGLCGTPENFFRYSFVCNFCPLALMKVNGCNVTPAEIKDIKIRKVLEQACDDTYLKLIRLLQPEIIIAIGGYIEKKTKDLFKTHGVDSISVAYMPHPSPRAVNNQNWHEKADTFILSQGLVPYFRNQNGKLVYSHLSYNVAHWVNAVDKDRVFIPKKKVIRKLFGIGKSSEETIAEHPTALSDTERDFMEQAFGFANEALAAQEVPVGCIFVHDDKVIALGRNTVNETRNATRHAEINCVDQVMDYCKASGLDSKVVFSEVCVYVTVEPCIMCAAALYDLKVRKIVYGCRNDRFGGQTVFDVGAVLRPVTELKGGYRAGEAMDLLKEFYKGVNPNAPPSKVKLKKDK